MKKQYILYLLLLASSIGCYEDKGNYDYKEPLVFKIDSIKDTYSRIALVDSLNITPQLTPDGGQYDCFWGIYQNNVQGYAPKLDTLCHTRQLSYKVKLEPGSYTLVFAAKEKTTGITQFKTSTLSVVTALTTGWYILRSQDGYTDIDVITETGTLKNIIASNNGGKKLKGEPNTLCYLTTYKAWDEANSRYTNTVTMFALANADAVALKVSNGKIINDFGKLFYETPAVSAPQDCFGSSDIYFVNNGLIHTIYGMSGNTGRFGEPKSGGYRLSPYRVSGGGRYPLLYDEATSSFCSADPYDNKLLPLSDESPVDGEKLPPANKMDMDLVFMGPRGYSYSILAWALMKRKQEDQYLMLKLNAACYTPYKNPILQYDTLDNSLKMITADKWATNLDNDIIYFAKGNIIYSCNPNAAYQEREQTTLPLGENITWMRHMKFNPYKQDPLWFDNLAIATYDGSKYKIYLYNLQGGNLKGEPKILGGEGKVGAAVYVMAPSYSTALP